jgi:anaerobic ribonucleoside-triphosphate reductase activating protein
MKLSISRVADRTEVLGPGIRAALWVRGCPLNCTGCISAEDIPFEGGTTTTVDDLAARFLALPDDVSGITFSGGEPMAQAAGLAALADRIRAERDWSVMAYSGFTLAHLRRHGTDDQRALLARLDLLVDGPYVQAQHAPLRWRGSRNQRLHYLTGRHRPDEPDEFAGLEFAVDDGRISWIGVPPVAGFRSSFESAMRTQGVQFTVEGEPDVP